MRHHTHNNPFRFPSAALLCAAFCGGSAALTAPALAQCNEWEPMPFTGPSQDFSPLSLMQYNGKTYAVNNATFFLLRLDGDSWVTVGLPSGVFPLAVHEGELLAGRFNGGVHRTVGGDDSQWELLGQANGQVYAIGEFEGDLIVAGDFTTIDGVAANRIARWDGSQWHPIGAGLDGLVWDMAVYDGTLVVGGEFSGLVAQWDGAPGGGGWTTVGTGISGDMVRQVVAYNGNLIAGGLFTHAGPAPANNIAQFNGTAWEPMLGGVSGGDGVWDMTQYGFDLVVVGGFQSANGDPTMGKVARWSDDPDNFGWHSMGDVFGSFILATLAADDWVMIGGSFGSIDGDSSKKFVVKWRDGVPGFTDHPQHVQVDEGADAIFTASIGDGANPAWTYQWRRDGVPLSSANNGNAVGYDTTTLTVTNVTQDDLGVYHLLAFNQCGASVSNSAVLSVIAEPAEPTCPGDLDGDGTVGVSDLLILLGAWGPCP